MPIAIVSSTNSAQNAGMLQPVPSRNRPSRQRVTVSIPTLLVERLRNAVYWTGHHTLAQIIVDSLEGTLAVMEHANGGPFPSQEDVLVSHRLPPSLQPTVHPEQA